MKLKNVIILSIIFSVLSAALTSFVILSFQSTNQNELIKDFYLTETAVGISPHSLRLAMDKGDVTFILVDLRKSEEYEKEHIVGAINIPEDDPDLVKRFAELPKDKEIIIYCYSSHCMTGKKVGKLLAENGIYVKELNIGWNEWKYYWDLWNHEGEKAKPEDYIVSGKEPGTAEERNYSESCAVDDLGC